MGAPPATTRFNGLAGNDFLLGKVLNDILPGGGNDVINCDSVPILRSSVQQAGPTHSPAAFLSPSGVCCRAFHTLGRTNARHSVSLADSPSHASVTFAFWFHS